MCDERRGGLEEANGTDAALDRDPGALDRDPGAWRRKVTFLRALQVCSR